MRRSFAWSIIAALLAVFPPLGVGAAPGLSAVLPAEARSLSSGGSLQSYRDDHRNVALIPNHPLAEQIARTLRSERPTVISERIIVVPRGLQPAEQLELYNSLRRVQGLSNLRYFNPRRGDWLDLFRQSMAVNDPSARQPIPDPVVTVIPPDDSVWVLQEMPPFGEILSQYRYVSTGDAFLFSSSNVDSLVYRGMRVARPGQTFSYILVIFGDDYLVTYGIGGVRAFTMFGLLDDRIEGAFGGRTDGLFNWYHREYLEPLEQSGR